eukprot:2520735-Rhodomonas_salina.4
MEPVGQGACYAKSGSDLGRMVVPGDSAALGALHPEGALHRGGAPGTALSRICYALPTHCPVLAKTVLSVSCYALPTHSPVLTWTALVRTTLRTCCALSSSTDSASLRPPTHSLHSLSLTSYLRPPTHAHPNHALLPSHNLLSSLLLTSIFPGLAHGPDVRACPAAVLCPRRE